MFDTLQTIPECDLGFVELNPDQTPTILFIHSAFSSPVEISLVAQHLPNYHFLIPAIHTNIKAPDPRPKFSIPDICAHISTLIQRKAKDGRAHVYGQSMGAHLALNVALRHPTEVLTVIASGIRLFSHWPWYKRAGLPAFIHAQAVLPRLVLSREQQIRAFNTFMRPASDTLAAECLSRPNEGDYAYCKEVCAALDQSLVAGKPVEIQARALVVAGTATVGDTVEDVQWVVREVRKAGGRATGVEIKQGGHPWFMQLPELCAKVIEAWIREEDLPDGALVVE